MAKKIKRPWSIDVGQLKQNDNLPRRKIPPLHTREREVEWKVRHLAIHAAIYANIQAPYPTTWSREPAVSPELHNESRRIFRPRRPVSSRRPAIARPPQA